MAQPQQASLAVDMMSGDFGLRTTLPAARAALSSHPHLYLHLVGDVGEMRPLWSGWPDELRQRSALLHAPLVVPMSATGAAITRPGPTTSLSQTIATLVTGVSQGVVSAGNTGALLALARQQLGLIDPRIKPAFCSRFPTLKGASLLLDLGANVDCSGQRLVGFALLGSALFGALHRSAEPTVALLSNGREPGKGNAVVREAAAALADDSRVNFVGYVEAHELHDGQVDVIVCDGFVGNIALKAIEGTASRAGVLVQQLLAGLESPLRESLLAQANATLNPDGHNGAFLLGLDGVVVKAHGHSSSQSFGVAIGQALECVEQEMVAKMITCLKGPS